MRRLSILCLLLLAGCASGARFDAQGWRDADLSTRERAEMAGDLIRTHRLDGLDRAAVIVLLGEPTPSDRWGGGEMIYVLGPDGSLFPIDNEWLLIELNPQGRVASYRVVAD